ncbi:MAG: nucleic acid-binding protein [Treponema sp.]|nr:nucleic acid-binding protein [Treponema sp.]
MKMSEEIRTKLEKLQEVLKEKYEIEEKMKELPKALDISKETLESLKHGWFEKNAEYESEKAKVEALKQELDRAVRDREMGEKNMDDIKTHREYEILDKQISEAQRKEEEIRKNLQQEERKLEELKDDLDNENELIESQKSDVEKIKAENDAYAEKFQQQLEELKAKEDEASEDIDNEIVYKFQRIIKRNQKGIVAIKGNVCEGCHMILPYQYAADVRSGDKVYFCPYCSRVIYYEEVQDGEEQFYSPEDTGSLLGVGDDDVDDEFADEDEDVSEASSSEEGAFASDEE